MDAETERAALAKAERDIVEGERRVSAQALRVGRMRANGDDTRDAEHLLLAMRENLAQWHAHRTEILETLRRLDAAPL